MLSLIAFAVELLCHVHAAGANAFPAIGLGIPIHPSIYTGSSLYLKHSPPIATSMRAAVREGRQNTARQTAHTRGTVHQTSAKMMRRVSAQAMSTPAARDARWGFVPCRSPCTAIVGLSVLPPAASLLAMSVEPESWLFKYGTGVYPKARQHCPGERVEMVADERCSKSPPSHAEMAGGEARLAST